MSHYLFFDQITSIEKIRRSGNFLNNLLYILLSFGSNQTNKESNQIKLDQIGLNRPAQEKIFES